jgi:hypothetical protein
LWRKIALESAPDNSIASMGTTDLSPLNSELLSGCLFGSRCLGNKGDLLSAVELGVFLGVHVLDLDQGNVLVLIPLSSLVPEDCAFDEQAGRAFGGHCHLRAKRVHERSE